MDHYTYDSTFSRIDRVEFAVWSHDDILNGSVLPKGGIESSELNDTPTDPKKGGLNDPRMGVSTNDRNCKTCGLSAMFCEGHFGHINLAELAFNIGYLNPFVHKFLTCICPRCSKPLIYKNEKEIKEILKNKPGKERMAYIKAASKNITYCQNPNHGCGAQIPKIKIEIKKASNTINIIAETELDNKEDGEAKKKLRQILTPDIVYDILKNVSDDDCRLLGMDPTRSRPEDMIHKTFPVPPVSMRPSVRGDFMGGSSMEDDLTHKLADIVKSNMRIIKNKENQNESALKYSADYAHVLQYNLITYQDNESTTMLKSEQKGKPLKSLGSRLKGKTGRVRGNLMGKCLLITGRC